MDSKKNNTNSYNNQYNIFRIGIHIYTIINGIDPNNVINGITKYLP